MRGIEAATAGTLAADVELKTSRNGNPFANFSLAVNQGNDEDGKPITQWVRCAVFGEAAEQLAARARKGDRVYVEGLLTLTRWADKATGAERHGLSMACSKAQVIGTGAIGKNKPPKRQPSRVERQLRGTSFAGESAPMHGGRDDPSDYWRDNPPW
jgi:single stranded DNA-binding protein